jgi:hypothetical protein
MRETSAAATLLSCERHDRTEIRDAQSFAAEKLHFLERSARRILIEVSTEVGLQTPLGMKLAAQQKAQDVQHSRAMKRAKSLVDEMRQRVEANRIARLTEAECKGIPVERVASVAAPKLNGRRESQYETLMKAARRYEQLSREIGALDNDETATREKIIVSQFERRKEILRLKIRSLEPQRCSVKRVH